MSSDINISSIQKSVSVSAISGNNSYSSGVGSADTRSGDVRFDSKYKLYNLMGPEKDYNKQSAVGSADSKSNPTLDNIKSVSSALKTVADNITAHFPPLFNQMTAALEKNDTLEVTSVNSSSVTEGTTEVTVAQTAEAQENSGNELKSDNINFETGSNRLKIKTRGGEYNINVNVSDNDTNRSVQNKTSDSINRRNIGVEARVSYNEENNTSALVVTARNTGRENSFSIEDNDNGNFASRLGVDNPKRQARDALYSVNGGELKSSASNEVYLGNGLNAELKSGSENSVTISLSRDTEKIKEQVSEFVTSFNDLLSTARDDLNSEKVENQLKAAFNAYSSDLEKSGIFYEGGSGGGLRMDEDMLNESISGDRLEKALGASEGQTNGFADRVGRIARNAEADPLRYADSQMSAPDNEINESSVSGLGVLYDSFV